jgi:NAD(P)-dependent dehydrogenase (short-subunit alcohol dehydrogenase family)
MRRVLVSGAASGIGRATVAAFRAEGARVAALDLDEGRLGAVEADVRVVADVADAGAVARAVEAAAQALGGLDVVVCSAGVALPGTVEMPLEDWDRTFAVNVRGQYLVAKAALPHLRRAEDAAIVTVGSNVGMVGAPNAVAYCASKGAVLQLTRAMAIDLAAEGIRVNCVAPGPTGTPMIDDWLAASPNPGADRERLEGSQLHGRLVSADEVAHAIRYLASPLAGSTIGAVLSVDGGYTVR